MVKSVYIEVKESRRSFLLPSRENFYLYESSKTIGSKIMVSDALLFTFALLDTAGILCLLIYFVITLSDLECDYLNAQQCCTKLNMWVLPKLIAHGFLTFLLLIHGHWILVLVNLPMALWLTYEHVSIPKGNTGVYDPTEIHNRGQLKKHMRDCMIYLGHYLLFFVVYLYCLIISLLQGNPIKKDDDYMTDMHDY